MNADFQSLKVGSLVSFRVERGKMDPVTQTKAKATRSLLMRVVAKDKGRLKVRGTVDSMTYPPDGVWLGAEHWRIIWMPHVTSVDQPKKFSPAPKETD